MFLKFCLSEHVTFLKVRTASERESKSVSVEQCNEEAIGSDVEKRLVKVDGRDLEKICLDQFLNEMAAAEIEKENQLKVKIKNV